MASNTVKVSSSTNTITIKWYSRTPSDIQSEISVDQLSPGIIQINHPGPKGADGTPGLTGPKGETGTLQSFENLEVTGGITTVTGSIDSTAAITVGENARSIKLIQGSQFGIFTSPVITSNYSRIQFQKDIFMGIHGGIGGTNPTKIFFDSLDTYIAADTENPENLEIHADNDIELRADGIVHANSIISASGFTGSLEGTSSFATTASYALNADGSGFPFTGSAEITGSLEVTGSIKVNTTTDPEYIATANVQLFSDGGGGIVKGGKRLKLRSHGGYDLEIRSTSNRTLFENNSQTSYAILGDSTAGGTFFDTNVTASGVVSASNGFIGDLTGTSSFATSSSFATTASYALNTDGSGFPFTGDAVIVGSLDVTGSINTTTNIVAGGNITAEGTVSASSFSTDGTGIPTLTSDSNLNLEAKNGGTVRITSSSLRLVSFASNETGSVSFAAGDVYFNTTVNKFMGFNGTTHVNLG